MLSRRRLAVLTVTFACLATLPVRADLPPLIPREVLFGNPDRVSPQVSPDAKRLAYIAPDAGVLNVWVRTIGRMDDKAVTKDRIRSIRQFFWAYDNKHILYLQDKGGDEDWHIHCVDLDAGTERDLTPLEGVQARLISIQPQFPDEILISLNDRTPELHDVYRVNLNSAERTLVAMNEEGFTGWTADHQHRLRVGVKPDGAAGTILMFRDTPDSPWRRLAAWSIEDALTSGPVAFTPNDDGLYLLNSIGSNTTQLRELDLKAGTEKVLASDDQADVQGVVIHPVTHVVQAVGFNKDRLRWKVIDPAVEADFVALQEVNPGDLNVINRDQADRVWLVSFTLDSGPVRFNAYDRQTKKAEFLFTNRKDLEKVELAKMQPIQFKSRDGLTVNGYLTTPPGVPARQLPTVLLVHGGPWARDNWGWNPSAQWLANRGYAVLQVNYRGSTGYGKQYVNAANREWAGKMHDDLIDGVKWAIKSGIADPKNVAIMGGSYGGYATLVGLTFTPDVFRCGVDIVGPSNLLTFMATIPPYWKPWEAVWWMRVGHPEKDRDFLLSRSPLSKIDQIKAPLLIAQGANDPRVKASESRQMVEAMKKAGKDVEYVEYTDEGHGFARPENRLDFYGQAEAFLAKHLGGRCEEGSEHPKVETEKPPT